jgi:hypothetical protein
LQETALLPVLREPQQPAAALRQAQGERRAALREPRGTPQRPAFSLPLPLRERVGVRGDQLLLDHEQHSIEVLQDLVIPEAD